MKKVFKLSFVLGCAGALGACNSGGGGGQAAAPMTPAVTMAATSALEPGTNKPLLEALQEENQSLTRSVAADLPASGTASYSGFAQIIADGTVIPNERPEIVGKADLEVSFEGSGGMTGTLTDFDDETGTYTGTLKVSDGEITDPAAGPTVRSKVSGTITRSSGEAYAVKGHISGGFFGNEGQYLNGFDDIKVTSDGTTVDTNISLNAARD